MCMGYACVCVTILKWFDFSDIHKQDQNHIERMVWLRELSMLQSSLKEFIFCIPWAFFFKFGFFFCCCCFLRLLVLHYICTYNLLKKRVWVNQAALNIIHSEVWMGAYRHVCALANVNLFRGTAAIFSRIFVESLTFFSHFCS